MCEPGEGRTQGRRRGGGRHHQRAGGALGAARAHNANALELLRLLHIHLDLDRVVLLQLLFDPLLRLDLELKRADLLLCDVEKRLHRVALELAAIPPLQLRLKVRTQPLPHQLPRILWAEATRINERRPRGRGGL